MKIDKQGRIYLPKGLLETKGWRSGDELLVRIVDENTISLTKPVIGQLVIDTETKKVYQWSE